MRQKLGSQPMATQLKLTLGLFDVVVHKASIMHVRSNYTQSFFSEVDASYNLKNKYITVEP